MATKEKATGWVPPGLENSLLIDAATAAGVGGVGLSWWLDRVRLGLAPGPAIQQPRCTRWRTLDVLAFWEQHITASQSNTERAAQVKARAKVASAAAQAKRRGRPTPTPGSHAPASV